MSEWISVKDRLPDNQDVRKSRRRYMAYSPKHGGYIFRCWYRNGFGAVYPEAMLNGVTHYRVALKSEIDHQLTELEIESVTKLDNGA